MFSSLLGLVLRHPEQPFNCPQWDLTLPEGRQRWERRRGDPPVIANTKVSDAAKPPLTTVNSGVTSRWTVVAATGSTRGQNRTSITSIWLAHPPFKAAICWRLSAEIEALV